MGLKNETVVGFRGRGGYPEGREGRVVERECQLGCRGALVQV